MALPGKKHCDWSPEANMWGTRGGVGGWEGGRGGPLTGLEQVPAPGPPVPRRLTLTVLSVHEQDMKRAAAGTLCPGFSDFQAGS